jgi:hypothetical protein
MKKKLNITLEVLFDPQVVCVDDAEGMLAMGMALWEHIDSVLLHVIWKHTADEGAWGAKNVYDDLLQISHIFKLENVE